MELLIIILNKPEYFEKLVSLLIEAGITGATISESEGIGHYLAFEIPIFAGLRQFFQEGKTRNRTITAVLDKEEIYNNLKNLLAEENIDFTEPGVGVIIKLPINEVIKSRPQPQTPL